jgi:tRNA uridine 5-carbamoylmethylation protein Kti12
MDQFLAIIRGAPASGKTTIAKGLRNFDSKIVWLKVDNFKDFFSEDAKLDEQKYVDECALETLKYLLDKGFSVVMEKIFYNPFIIPLAIKEAEKRNIKNKVYQITCSLQTLQERDKTRPGIKEGCRKPLGDEIIKKLYDKLEETIYPGSISLDTEKMSEQECVQKIKEDLGIK